MTVNNSEKKNYRELLRKLKDFGNACELALFAAVELQTLLQTVCHQLLD